MFAAPACARPMARPLQSVVCFVASTCEWPCLRAKRFAILVTFVEFAAQISWNRSELVWLCKYLIPVLIAFWSPVRQVHDTAQPGALDAAANLTRRVLVHVVADYRTDPMIWARMAFQGFDAIECFVAYGAHYDMHWHSVSILRMTITH